MPATFLYVNIGRGHPFYLDGIRACLPAESAETWDIADLPGLTAHAAWRLAAWLYERGSSLGGGTTWYDRIRRRADCRHNPLALRLLGRPARRAAARRSGPLVVSHPLLAAILRNYPDLVYQHGELVLPAESIINCQGHFIVPLAAQADELKRHGLADARILVSGLCIEPALAAKAETLADARLRRYRTDAPLTGALFSSGAEPAPHAALLARAAASAARAGGRTIVFARTGGRLARHMAAAGNSAAQDQSQTAILTYQTHAELDNITAGRFHEFDYFIAPAHERANWALGLGLPMFILEPCIGSFAPLNRDLLLRRGAAGVIAGPAQAETFGQTLSQMRRGGALEAMALRNRGSFDINGFQTIADWLTQAVSFS